MLLSIVLLGLASFLAGCGDLGPAKDFTVVPLDDQAKSVSLKDMKGRVVLLDFWATYCGPCRTSMPEVQAIWDRYRSQGLQVMSISGEPRSAIFAFHRSSGYTFPVYIDEKEEAASAYQVSQIPRFVLIKQGRIIWDELSPAQGELSKAVFDAFR